MLLHSYEIKNFLNPDLFAKASEMCQIFCERQDKAELGGWDGEGSPLFSKDVISFNGKTHQGHQTFQIRLNGTGPRLCDTNHNAYDVVVRGCLLILKYVFEDGIDIHIDGGHEPSTELARALVSKYTGASV